MTNKQKIVKLVNEIGGKVEFANGKIYLSDGIGFGRIICEDEDSALFVLKRVLEG